MYLCTRLLSLRWFIPADKWLSTKSHSSSSNPKLFSGSSSRLNKDPPVMGKVNWFYNSNVDVILSRFLLKNFLVVNHLCIAPLLWPFLDPLALPQLPIVLRCFHVWLFAELQILSSEPLEAAYVIVDWMFWPQLFLHYAYLLPKIQFNWRDGYIKWYYI